MQNIYDKLFNAQPLTQQESQYLFNAIIQGEPNVNNALPLITR